MSVSPRAAEPVALPAWSEFRERLRHYVLRRVHPASVDDITGDILLRLLEHEDSLGEARDPLAWAYRVAASVIADHYRRGAVEARALEQVRAESDAPGPAPGAVESDETRQRLEACLLPFVLDLPPKYAEALVLTSFQGVSQAEAARRLGLSVSGMKSRVQRARALLKRRFIDCCHFERDRRGRVIDMQPRRASVEPRPADARGQPVAR